MRFSISCGFFIDWNCFLFVLWLMELLRGWKFDEIEDKSSSTEKPNSYSGSPGISERENTTRHLYEMLTRYLKEGL
jgi:hypothetical protein